MSLSDVNPRPRKRRTEQPQSGSKADEAGEKQDNQEDDYKVGYKNPPKWSRFPPGVSGNRKGKAKGTKSFRVCFERALDVKVIVVEGNKKRKLSKREAAAVRAANRAVEGDPKTLDMMLRHDRGHEQQSVSADTGAAIAPLTNGEQSILDHFKAAAREAVLREQEEPPE